MQLTEYLANNIDAVLELLNLLEYKNISQNKQKGQIRFSREYGRNPTSVVMNMSTLSMHCFSDNTKGNIYTLVMAKNNLSFPDALSWVADKLGLEKSKFNKKTRYPFGGFYKGIIREIEEPEYAMKTYDAEVLEEYSQKFNLMFFHDGIDFQTQEKYMIGYDVSSNRITVPIWTLDNKLCGIMGRLNDTKCAHEERWLPIIPCSRTLTLGSYNQNYAKIQEKGLAVIGESEKFPLQMDSFGSEVGLATCGCDISETQAKYVKSLLIPKVILAYDEGLEEDYIREEARKLKINNAAYTNQVGYVFDHDNKYLPCGSKKSPTDRGREIFSHLIKEKVKWLE